MTRQKEKELESIIIKLSNVLIDRWNKKGFLFTIKQAKISEVFYIYNFIKEHTKVLISKEDFRQDRHKIAAIFIFSLIEVDFIEIKKIPSNKTITKEEAEMWFKLILSTSFAAFIIFAFKNESLLDFTYPITTTKKPYKSFLMGLIKKMAENYSFKDTDKNKILNYIHSLSNILFLLEQYTYCNNKM